MAAHALRQSAPASETADSASARAAGLRYVDDRRPGLRRRRAHGKLKSVPPGAGDFVVEDRLGRVVRDPATLERVRKLAIPPAWQDVWICADADGHLQATGRDARRRKQYRYHPRWREERDGNKYSRMIDFGRAIPALRRRISADLKLTGLPRRKVLATVVRLLETTFIRVGNEEYARTNKSFGLTTLKDRHVDFGPAEVRFHFRGKSGVSHEISVHDPAIARIVKRCRDLPGQELFQYVGEDGAPATIDSADVNDYIRDAAGEEFTAKDFRTWAGTVLAARALRDAARVRGSARRPSSRDVVRAIQQVAARLGNTPSVCRKCYVHPQVIAAYLDGTLAAALDVRGDVRTTAAGADRHLRAEELAVLALLERRLADEKKGSGLEKQLRRSLRAGIAQGRPVHTAPSRTTVAPFM